MKSKLLALAALAFSLLPGRGENVLSDSFTFYPNGPIVGALGSPWVANTGIANSMLVSNLSLEISSAGTRTEDIAAPLSRLLTNTTDTAAYASFKIKFISLPGTNAGSYIAHFTAAGALSNHRGRIFASTTNTSASGKMRLGIGNTSGSSAASAPYPTELDTNVVYTVVTRIDLTTGLCTLWIDPIDESDPSITDTTPLGVQAISHFGFRQNTGGGVSRVNNLRVGSTFADVAGPNAPPSISSISSFNLPANTSSGPIAFTVGDLETPVASLTLSSTSTNTTLLPTNNIIFGGSGANRTVTITPVLGQEGTSLVGITVTDGSNATATTTFTVTVGAPTISNIGNQVTPTNVPLSGVAFTVNDAETPGSLVITKTSSNTNLLPEAGITVVGSGANRTLTLTPTADQAGFTLVTVTVSDGTQSASDTFVLTVFPKLGLLIDEPFSYADETQIAGGSTDWINHSGIFGQTLVRGGKLLINQTNTEDFNREYFPQVFYPSNGVILYASFMVNFTNLPSAGGGYFSHTKDDGTLNFRGRVFSSSQSAPAGQFRLGVANTAAAIATNGLHPTFLTTNQTYKVVTRYNTATAETTLWVNPASESSTSVSATDAAANAPVFSYAFRQDSGIGTFTVDDLKVGTEFTDVSTVVQSYSLRAFKSGSDVIVAWPTAASGFTLQSCNNLTTTNWQNVLTTPSVVGSENFVTNTAPTGNAFFRLKN
jgi:hypothetical protein